MATLTNCQYMVDGRKGPGKGLETSFKSEYNLEFKCLFFYQKTYFLLIPLIREPQVYLSKVFSLFHKVNYLDFVPSRKVNKYPPPLIKKKSTAGL